MTSSNSSQRSDIRWLLRRTEGVRLAWFVATGARVANQLLMVAVLVCAGNAILEAQLMPWLWWILGLSLAKACLRYLEHFSGHWVAFTVLTRMRTEFYDALVPQAPAVAKGNGASELSERATVDIDRVEVFFAHTIPPAVAAVIVPTVSIGWVWGMLGATSAALMALASVIMIGGPALARKLSWPDVRQAGESRAQIAVHLGDTLQGNREIASFDASELRIAELKSLESDLENPLRRVRNLAGLRSASLVIIELLTLALLVSSLAGVNPAVSVLSALVWVGLWSPLRGIDDFVDGLDDALESTERVRRVVDATPVVQETAGSKASVGLATVREGSKSPLLTIESVSFDYPQLLDRTSTEQDLERPRALSDVSVEILPGSWTYFAGVSGSGKSTLAALIARGYDPTEGIIRYQGSDIRDVPISVLRSHIALVTQRPYLISGTLEENLRLSNKSASEEELWKVLRVVLLDQWAKERGLAGQIEADGKNISGGQIQRIAIARALLAEPQVLILDEATSQLDDVTSKMTSARIREEYPDLTVLEISHQVDRIPPDSPVIVIDGGELLESGLAQDLLRKEDGYLHQLASR